MKRRKHHAIFIAISMTGIRMCYIPWLDQRCPLQLEPIMVHTQKWIILISFLIYY